MKDWVHPAVRRGTLWFKIQAIGLGGLAAIFVILAILDRTTKTLIYAIVACIVAVVLGYLARRAIKQLRYDYRYEEEEGNPADQP